MYYMGMLLFDEFIYVSKTKMKLMIVRSMVSYLLFVL